jgi:hypothetical protein
VAGEHEEFGDVRRAVLREPTEELLVLLALGQ